MQMEGHCAGCRLEWRGGYEDVGERELGEHRALEFGTRVVPLERSHHLNADLRGEVEAGQAGLEGEWRESAGIDGTSSRESVDGEAIK